VLPVTSPVLGVGSAEAGPDGSNRVPTRWRTATFCYRPANSRAAGDPAGGAIDGADRSQGRATDDEHDGEREQMTMARTTQRIRRRGTLLAAMALAGTLLVGGPAPGPATAEPELASGTSTTVTFTDTGATQTGPSRPG
jgi:hypothetical protein